MHMKPIPRRFPAATIARFACSLVAFCVVSLALSGEAQAECTITGSLTAFANRTLGVRLFDIGFRPDFKPEDMEEFRVNFARELVEQLAGAKFFGVVRVLPQDQAADTDLVVRGTFLKIMKGSNSFGWRASLSGGALDSAARVQLRGEFSAASARPDGKALGRFQCTDQWQSGTANSKVNRALRSVARTLNAHFKSSREQIARVDELIAKGGPFNTLDKKLGWDPLSLACRLGDVERVQTMLDKGAKAAAQDSDGWAPIMWAGVSGNLEIVKLLAGKGADVNARTKKGSSALILAASHENWHAIPPLLELGADVKAKDANGFTPLILSARHGQVGTIALLRSKGAELIGATQHEFGAISLLHWAAFGGASDLVNELLASSGDANALDGRGHTPLMMAAEGGHPAVVKALLAKQADVNLKSPAGASALTLAQANGREEVARLLIEAGAK